MKKIYQVLCFGAFMVPALLFAQKPVVMVKKASAAITVDGVGTDAAWSAAPKIAIDKPYTGETVVNGEGTFQMLYDADNLYVFVNVKDDVVTVDTKGDWKGDKFELYLGLPGYIPGDGAGSDHARQFAPAASQDWVDNATKLTHPGWYSTDLWPGVASRATDGVTFAFKETVDGYAFEFKINKSALENVDFATIDSLGFDFTFSDNDIVGEGLGVRNRKVFYNTGNLQYANENWSAMDLATLVFDKSTASANLFNTSEQAAYISNDILRFKGFDSAVDVEVYSILGQKVLVAKNIQQLNVSSLKNGIYLVRVNNGKQAFKVMK